MSVSGTARHDLSELILNERDCSRLRDLGQVKSKRKVQVVFEFLFGLIFLKMRQYKKSECRPYVRLYLGTVLFGRCDHGILAHYENAQTFKGACQSMK